MTKESTSAFQPRPTKTFKRVLFPSLLQSVLTVIRKCDGLLLQRAKAFLLQNEAIL